MHDQTKKIFRWAFLGTGPVARKFLYGLRELGNKTEVVVVASRQKKNAEIFANDFGIGAVAEDYASAVMMSEVDGIYIATPPSEHEVHALLGIAAGKPVLIEKPVAMDAAAAIRINDAAQKAGVLCMEAMWTRFLPLIVEIKERIDAGEIGTPRAFHGCFLGAVKPDSTTSLFNKKLGGGALMHRGVYPLSIARHLLGPICEINTMAQIGDSGVDEDCAVTLRHDSGAISTLRASLRVNGENEATIYGTDGTIRIKSPIYRPFCAEISRTKVRTGSQSKRRIDALKEGWIAQSLNQRIGPLAKLILKPKRRINAHFGGNGYHYEAAAFMESVANGLQENPIMPFSESIEIMRIIDQAQSKWKNGCP